MESDIGDLCVGAVAVTSWVTSKVLFIKCSEKTKRGELSYCLHPEQGTKCSYHPQYEEYQQINRRQ